jgi:hypothetical protein
MVEQDFVEYLALQARSGVTALHQYRLLATSDEKQIHVFLEGEDDVLFYLPEVRARSGGREVFVYLCGGKGGVIEALRALENDGYDLASSLFFVDRDHSEYTGCNQYEVDVLYTTDFYSIESHIVSKQSLEIMLVDMARMSKSDPAYMECINKWDSEYRDFCVAIRPIMAWSMAMRSEGKKPNFNNADLAKVFEFNHGHWRRAREGFRHFVKSTVRAGEGVACSTLKEWISKLTLGREKCWIRGKYELWFFETFLLRCLEHADPKAKRWKIPSALRERRIMDVLSARVSCPQSCASFLEARLGPRS